MYPYDWNKARILSIPNAGEDEESRDFSGMAGLQKPPWPYFPKVTRLTTHSVALLGQLRRETLARVDPGTFAGMVTATRPAEGSLAAPRCPPPGDCVNEPQCSRDTEQPYPVRLKADSKAQTLSCHVTPFS